MLLPVRKGQTKGASPANLKHLNRQGMPQSAICFSEKEEKRWCDDECTRATYKENALLQQLLE